MKRLTFLLVERPGGGGDHRQRQQTCLHRVHQGLPGHLGSPPSASIARTSMPLP